MEAGGSCSTPPQMTQEPYELEQSELSVPPSYPVDQPPSPNQQCDNGHRQWRLRRDGKGWSCYACHPAVCRTAEKLKSGAVTLVVADMSLDAVSTWKEVVTREQPACGRAA
jgi:hypothetical protein